jgi:hypothetical protein
MPEGVDMRSCAACGGLIGEPGKAYEYPVRLCHCTKPLPVTPGDAYPPITGAQPGTIQDFIEKHDVTGGTTGTAILPGPVIAMPKPETVTPAEFVSWLRGYFAAGGPNTLNQADFKRIAEELKRVRT